MVGTAVTTALALVINVMTSNLPPWTQRFQGFSGWGLGVTAILVVFLSVLGWVSQQREGVPFNELTLGRHRRILASKVQADCAHLLEPLRSDWLHIELSQVSDLVSKRSRENTPSKDIGTHYQESSGELLLVGAAGSGKSTQVLLLTEKLLSKAAEQREEPIPAVFQLSAWTSQAASLENWLSTALHELYGVPESISHEFVRSGEILPILDGLDEVPPSERLKCITQINEFRRRIGLPIVVTSRDFTAKKRLRLRRCVHVDPVPTAEVKDYLHRHRLDDLLDRATADPSLFSFLRSPLILTLIREVQAMDPQRELSNEERLETLALAFVEQVALSLAKKTRYRHGNTIKWLAWFSIEITFSDSKTFDARALRPRLLPTWAKWLVRMGPFYIAHILVAMALGIIPATAFCIGAWKFPRLPIGSLNFSRPLALLGFRVGVIVAGVADIIFTLASGSPWKGLLWYPLAPLLGLYGGLWHNIFFPTSSPPQGSQIFQSTRSAVLAGLPFGLVVASIAWAESGHLISSGALRLGAAVFFMLSFSFGLLFVLDQLLIRGLLKILGRLPWRYTRFLDSLVEQGLFIKTNQGYGFRHPLLLQVFTKLLEDEPKTPEK